MEVRSKTVRGVSLRTWAHLLGSNPKRKYGNIEPPLRTELFSADQMEQHGKTLAMAHQVRTKRSLEHLLARLSENENVLLEVHRLLTAGIDADLRLTPAGEWLLDNFYLIEEQIRTAKRHLPKGYSRELPHLLNGPSAGLPRVYDIALEAISHSDGRVDMENLSRFVTSYQTVNNLKLGELWAIPIMLRLALIENLRQVAARIAAARIDRIRADDWANQMTDMAATDPKSLILVIADMARSNPPMVSSFIAELTRRLQGHNPALALPLTWIEQRLSEAGLTIEQLVRSENQQQAADQVSISNSIGSLRLLGAIDWHEFVETMSIVERTLCDDPGDFYRKMDFVTRDHYRHVVERIAKSSPCSESEVALKAIQLAKEGTTRSGGNDRISHVGFYLIDDGLSQLERIAGVRLSISGVLQKVNHRCPLLLYGGAILLLTMIIAWSFVTKAYSDGSRGWLLGVISLLSTLGASHLAVGVVNWLATLFATPKPLPRMDFSKGIPPEFRTLVVVPAMLTNTNNTEDLIEALEVRFLANRDNHLHFGLLTDFRDASEETLPEDETLLRLARLRIEELNEKYQSPLGNNFFLFHRPRKWNPHDRIWMGFERKRGKLADLNKLLRSGSSDRFTVVVGDTAVLPDMKFVITLDTDTRLARDSASQFVGALAHPLNHACYDEKQQRIGAGYGILQPRVAVSLPGANRSRYARMCTNEFGIDPYTRAVSDVYQDLFGEGSFIGKGIYQVEAFERVLKDRLPNNRILSHDLLEGCYARAGLLSDVQLYEEYPSRYSSDVNRRHRWIRGDWQIAQWVLPFVPGSDGHLKKNPLSILSRWKILDNLRHSLTAAALTLLLLLGWIVSPSIWFWTLAVLGIVMIPSLFASAFNVLQKPVEMTLAQHLSAVLHLTSRHFAQVVFMVVSLPYEAFFSLDAITRTAWRILISHKRLLQWNPSGESERNCRTDLADSYLTMWIGPFVAVSTMLMLIVSKPFALVIAAPILILWFASPAIAWWISLPLVRCWGKLSMNQVIFLRKLSRKTWSFFETFVGPEDHWLPPDNYQEHPIAVIAHRTSPTNIGLALLANLSAFDFGYVSTGKLIERTGKTLHTMNALERHKGHFYNWYDTQTLNPLLPLYISSVDSGNLAGHLLTLRSGLLALPDHKIIRTQFFEGLCDTIGVIIETLGNSTGKETCSDFSAQLAQIQQDLKSVTQNPPATLTAYRLCLDQLMKSAAELVAGLEVLEADPENRLNWWVGAFATQCRDAYNELILLVPWTELLLSHNCFEFSAELDKNLSLRELTAIGIQLPKIIEGHLTSSITSEERAQLDKFQSQIATGTQSCKARIVAINELARSCDLLAQMDYDFLYDKTRHLLTIGYNVAECRRDSSYYDLLASEARFSEFVAISQGKVPQESWFALGRLLTTAGGEPILLSWSGSMFEYLMPLLVMPTYEHTLLDQTCKAAVARQIEYGKKRNVPWGISESGYNGIDAQSNYQYRAFGVPGLGLKRGLADDLVIAPYASALALMVAPKEACQNLERLASEGFESRYGFYEAIDYTPSRLPRGQSCVIVRSFMAHHQGMSLLSLDYLLQDHPMQKRFKSEPLFQATLLLLQERIPKVSAFYAHTTKLSEHDLSSSTPETPIRVFTSPDTPNPEVQLLSNGKYHVMVTNAGGGYSHWKDLAVTRWREDRTRDNWGTFCYLRDVSSGEFWSTAFQPTHKSSKSFEAIFSEGRAEFRGRDHNFDTYTEIAVSPEDDIEVRRTRITNRARTRRTIEVTSYAEVVLASPAADALHSAFSNLFVQTEIIRRQRAILCTRRPRSLSEHPPWMLHLMAVHGAEVGEISYETDRMKFVGRGNTVACPQAMSEDAGLLSGTEGSVLDPIVAIRYRIALEPEESATINIVSGIAETREAALSLVEKYQDRRLADRVFELAWTHSQVLLRQINATETDAQLYGRLASSIVYANISLRADPSTIMKNHRGQSGLWGHAISGDLPIVLLQIEDPSNILLVRQLIQAHAYWRLKGLSVDLVIWNEDHAGYRQILHDQIMGLIASGTEANATDRPGGIFVRPADQIAEKDRILIQTVARVIITDSHGSLENQINGRGLGEVLVPRINPSRTHRPEPLAVIPLPRSDLKFFNGLGGFTPDGREYVITTANGQLTPTPWVNVLSNPEFGSVISESGSAYTWSENAHEFRLTPWGNDPVSDSSGEAIYLRDEERGHFWSPTPLPCRGITPYVTRHGFGYSVFEHTERGIYSELWVYVALDAAIKFMVLKVRNVSDRSRRLSATGYAEWVLGDLPSKSSMHLITEIDQDCGSLFARNPYNTEFRDRTAFFDVDDTIRSVSGDRTEFIGRNGTQNAPAAMKQTHLSNKVGAGLDPCAAIQVNFDLTPGQEREIVFRLGVGRDTEEARKLVKRFRGLTAAHNALEMVWQHWTHTLGTINVETPDQSLNVLANGWLVYQTLACRLWARTATYQSGGAFGFRDQLQDVMALIHAKPNLVREHLLRCASHQFLEGDVQHWWHPPSGRGVRTHCSDDYLWLPLATCRYILETGDTDLLNEPIHFLQGRLVKADEDSYYDLPAHSEETASLYEHCVRAIRNGFKYGKHGLPLIGTGDWNDGYNLVGEHGKGESVWLGFFLYEVLTRFASIARIQGDEVFAKHCIEEAEELRRNIETNGWDGEWYRRAYFDDGSPLGSSANSECKIDSIVQSWAVLSGAGENGRSYQAMKALDENLVRRETRLIQLLDPPFDKSTLDPGYIRGYVPGVRENGGQYTHAAIWAAMAFARMKDSQKAWELFTIINPVNHAITFEQTNIYKVEPYVVAADVYSAPPHTGRGGWTWYSGSAGWLYQLIMESLLGLRLEVDKLRMNPCLPSDWKGYKIHYRYRETVYHIEVLQAPAENDEMHFNVDGIEQPDNTIPLIDDQKEHWVEVLIPKQSCDESNSTASRLS